MYGIVAEIYHKFKPNIGKYSIHFWFPSDLGRMDPLKLNLEDHPQDL